MRFLKPTVVTSSALSTQVKGTCDQRWLMYNEGLECALNFCLQMQLTGFWSRAYMYIRLAIVHFSSVLTERTAWFISRNLQIPLAFLSWKLALRMLPTWSRPSWPWLLRSRREWALEPQLEALRSLTWRSRALRWSLHLEAAAEAPSTPTPHTSAPGSWSKSPHNRRKKGE